MVTIDDLFRKDTERELHPKVLYWRDVRDRDGVAKTELELRRPHDLLGFKPAELYITFFDSAGKRISCDHAAWDIGLREDLVLSGFGAKSK